MADMAALAATVTEKLSAMTELSAERAKTTDQILSIQRAQETKINKLVTDMAVMKTQQESFWKGLTILGTLIGAGASIVGFAIAQLVPLLHR